MMHRTLIVVLVVCFTAAILAVQVVAHQRAERATAAAIAACERGNEIRAYLAFDNDERIARIEQQLANPAQITDADARAFRAELERRYGQRDRLVPFPCATLR